MVHWWNGRRNRARIARKDAREPEEGSRERANYLNRSSNALRAPVGAADFVSRSTVVRGSNNVHVFRPSFGDTLAGTGLWHSNAAPESKWTHCAHECSSPPHL